MTSPSTNSPTSTWQDRRSLFQSGKQVHEPARRPSGSVGSGNDLVKTISGASANSATSGGARRSSNAQPPSSPSSGASGMFANLTGVKRGSQDYGTRRTSITDQHVGGGGGWFAETFKGHAPAPSAGGAAGLGSAGKVGGVGTSVKGGELKRGVME